MDLSQWILIIISLSACIYASYTDLRSYRVLNTCTFGLIFLGFLVQLVRVLLGNQSIFAFLSLFLVSGGIAFALYRFGVMGAGDAKLFWGFCLIVPTHFFQDMVGRPVFPPVVLMVNIFGVYFFSMLFYLLAKSSKAQKRQVLRKFPWKETPERFVELLGFIGFGSFIYAVLIKFPQIYFPLGPFLRLVLTLLLFWGYRKVVDLHPVSRRYWILPILIAFLFFLRLYTLPLWTIYRYLLTLTGLYVLAFFVFRILYLQLGFQLLNRKVEISELTAGMIAAEQIWRIREEGNIRYIKTPFLLRPSKEAEKVFIQRLKGLSKEQIAELRELAYSGAFQSFENALRIQNPISFAPIISLGVLVTFICQGTFYNNPLLGKLL